MNKLRIAAFLLVLAFLPAAHQKERPATNTTQRWEWAVTPLA